MDYDLTMDFSQTLNNDTLIEIFTYLDNSSLLNSSSVSKHWHQVAQHLIDGERIVALAVPYRERNIHLFKRMTTDAALIQRIKRIVVRDWHHLELESIRATWTRSAEGYFSDSYSGPPEEYWENTRDQVEALAEVLRNADLKLRSFCWSAIPSMPEPILKVLSERRPACDVHIRKNLLFKETIAWAYTPYFNFHSLSGLETLPNIVTLDIAIPPMLDPLFQALGAFIFTRRQTLRTLKLTSVARLWPRTNGTVSPSLPGMNNPEMTLVHYMGWLIKPLKLTGEKLRLNHLELTNFCICASSPYVGLDELIITQDLNKLEISCFGFLKHCHEPTFPSLRDISLGFRNGYVMDKDKCISDWPSETVQSFLSTCTTLRRLAIVDRPNVLSEAILNALGHQLVAIDVHYSIPFFSSLESEKYAPYHTADYAEYPESVTARLSYHCKGLEDLSISIPTKWPQSSSILDQMAKSLPQLRKLHLFRAPEMYSTPSFGKSSMLPLWTRFRESGGMRLEEMTLHMQIWTRPVQYGQLHQYKRWSSRTYFARSQSPTSEEDRSEVTVGMLEHEQVEKETLEQAPQCPEFHTLYRSLKLLCNEGQPTNNPIRPICRR